jgi:hypothetical protein
LPVALSLVVVKSPVSVRMSPIEIDRFVRSTPNVRAGTLMRMLWPATTSV